MTDFEKYFESGRSNYQLGLYGAAIKDFEKAIEINPNSSESYDYLGMCHNNSGNYDSAISCAKKQFKLIRGQILLWL